MWRDCFGRRLVITAFLMVAAALGIEAVAFAMGWDLDAIIKTGGAR